MGFASPGSPGIRAGGGAFGRSGRVGDDSSLGGGRRGVPEARGKTLAGDRGGPGEGRAEAPPRGPAVPRNREGPGRAGSRGTLGFARGLGTSAGRITEREELSGHVPYPGGQAAFGHRPGVGGEERRPSDHGVVGARGGARGDRERPPPAGHRHLREASAVDGGVGRTGGARAGGGGGGPGRHPGGAGGGRGASVEREEPGQGGRGILRIDTREVRKAEAPYEMVKTMRAIRRIPRVD